ncbi:hypothetical protein COT51_03105 [candidate division WWE3 bacterium CG08_land_8_20_14_0_20_41_15]|uniref:SHS2 domain-containing protein n=2 Tax=Katanobacteria TaxID=422282 RepID=A0A2H0X903_UNCKA|nr:MAG: hypothetical protein COT51_03105 [candidate division WWE3 bacterium CG08_land_8_20_14_0_20_41_15]
MNFPAIPKILLFNKAKGKPAGGEFLALEVDSEVAKAARFKYSPDGGIELLAIGKHQITDPSACHSGVIFNRALVTEALNFAIKRAISDYASAPKDVIFGIFGSQTKCFSTVARSIRESPEEKVTEKEIMETVDRIEEAAFSRALGVASFELGDPNIEVELTNSAIVSVTADENLVLDDSNFTGEKIEMTLFTAFSPRKHINMIQDICKELGLNLLMSCSETYSLTQSLSPSHNQEFNSILIDIRRDLTNVCVIFGSGPKESLSFGIGAKDISASEDNINHWLVSLDFILTQFEGIKTFPSEVIISGEGAKVVGLPARINAYPFTKNLPFKEMPSAKLLSYDNIHKIKVPPDLALLEDISAISLGVVYPEIR